MSRPLGFLLLMLGLGLRLDSTWQLLASLLIVCGAVVSGLGLARGRAAFVPPGDTR
ncbi:MAG TPA: hypothetical protein VGR62_17825 [Candidatus Binatia bacterium]|jgi:hypothetical protein|nr:hypothetical protein [Candidatus Binatia bacterium]